MEIPVLIAPPAVANPVTDYVPSGRPGGRAPHVWLEQGGARLSTIDLIGQHFTLMAGPRGGVWVDAARRVADATRIPIAAHTTGGASLGNPDRAWTRTYGVDDDGAVLVRPDGYVAWRRRSRATPDTLARAAERAVGR